MTQYSFDETNAQILVEIQPTALRAEDEGYEETTRGIRQALGNQLVHLSDSAIHDALELVGRTARQTGMMLVALQAYDEQKDLSGVELNLALKFTLEGNVAIATIGGEANLSVRLTWRKA